MAAPPTARDSFDDLIAEGVVEMGEHSYGSPKVVVWRSPVAGRMGAHVRIGRFCSIGPGVVMLTGGNHRADLVSTFPFRVAWNLPDRDRDGQTYSNGDIIVGSDVWIGQDVTVLSGVTIGSGAVIGAAAVVTKDVPPYAIVAGNPATVVRMRFEPDEVAQLLRIAWWDLPEHEIRASVHLLNGASVDEFIRFHDGRSGS